MIEILTSQELYGRGEIDEAEIHDIQLFMGRKVIVFPNEREAIQFAYNFVHQYLIPKYGEKNATKFPMAKSGPARSDLFDEVLGLIPKKQNVSAWLVIPENRFSEVEEFLEKLSL